MKCNKIKLTITLIFFIAITSGIYTTFSGQLPDGWFAAGSHPQDYNIGIDSKVTHGGKVSAYIKSKEPEPRGFGTLMQMFKADDFRGKRICMSGYAKAENIKDWAGLWMRVDGPENEMLSFDNMQDRPIRGTTEWQKYEIVLDVPENSLDIAFGILLSGKGRVWIDDLQFKEVSKDVPTTGLGEKGTKHPKQPINLDFES